MDPDEIDERLTAQQALEHSLFIHNQKYDRYCVMFRIMTHCYFDLNIKYTISTILR